MRNLNVRHVAIALCAILFACTASAEIVAEWNWKGDQPSKFFYSRDFVSLSYPKMETPDGEAVVAATYDVAAKGNDARLIFGKNLKIAAGTKYKLTFWIKSSTPITVSALAIVLEAPYQSFKSSFKTLSLTTEWFKYEREFVADKDFDASVAVPLLKPKTEVAAGTTIFIGPVRLEKLERILPLPKLAKWTMFVKPGVDPNTLNGLAAIPEKLGEASAVQVELGDKYYTIAEMTKAKDEAVFMTEFESDSDGVMQAGCAADWWFECLVNGTSVAETLGVGNRSHEFAPTDNVFNFPVRKGKNLIVVRVISGSSGGKFVFGQVPFTKSISKITEIVRSPEWRPMKMDEAHWNNRKLRPVRIDSNKIIAGTALDISQFLPKYDIDKLGFLRADAEGRLVSSNDPSVRVKLYGMAFFPAPHGSNFFRMKHEEIEELAEQIRLAGHSVVRLHFIDQYLMGFGGWPFLKRPPKKSRDEVKIPLRAEDLPIDKDALDRIDYFTKCLRDRGIYILLDIRSTTMSWSGESYNKKPHDNFQYRFLIGDPEARANYTAVFNFFMEHVNPYTNKKFKEDPQFMGITLYNEPDHCYDDKGLSIFDLDWQRYRKEKGIEGTAVFDRKLLVAETPEGAAAREFMIGILEDTSAFLLKTIKESGYKGFANLYDMRVRLDEGFGRRNFSAMAMHAYWALPRMSRPLTVKNYKQKTYFRPWWKGKMDIVDQRSALRTEGNYIAQGAVTRVLGKPFFLPEYAHGNYNQFSQEGGIMMGAYAALQDWDLLTAHQGTVRLYYMPTQASTETAADPTQYAGRILTSMMWRRGDVKPGVKAVNIQVPESSVRSKNLLGRIGSGTDFLFMICRIGASYDGIKRGDAEVVPEKFIGYHDNSAWHVTNEDRADQLKIMHQTLRAMKEQNIIPAGNRTDIDHGIFESDTGEIVANVKEGSLRVVTPRLEALCVKKGGKLAGNLLSLNSTTLPVTVSAISIDGETTLENSKRVLLLVQTMGVSEHSTFSTDTFDSQIDEGHMQMLIRSGKFDITLATKQGSTPRLYALNSNGSREKELPVELEDGKLRIKLDTTKLEYGTPFFELVY